ncbi:MAG: glycosyltransferase family 2 protein [Candidatus Kaelpia imicola]|nr:glycosyltransferase family 2 protein [Candidatus Kaelpia imicola]
MEETISVVVVNYNRREYLYNCLKSVSNQSYCNIELIVVDNGSSDGSIEMVEGEFPEVKIVKNRENIFLATPYNQGIRYSIASLILCMNNDVILERDYIKESVPVFKKDRRIGSVAGKLINPITKLIDSTGQILTRARRGCERGYREEDSGNYSEGYIWGVGGAIAFYRREMLEDIEIENEYFDQTYKAYLEDLDLNWRGKKRGWKSYFKPSAVAFHYRGVTGWRERSRFGFLNLNNDLKVQYLKNRYATLIKNETLGDYIKNLPYILLYDSCLLILLISINPLCILYLVKDISWLKSALRRRRTIKERWLN